MVGNILRQRRYSINRAWSLELLYPCDASAAFVIKQSPFEEEAFDNDLYDCSEVAKKKNALETKIVMHQ